MYVIRIARSEDIPVPEYRRQGIGSRLLKEALDFARSEGITHATLHASKSGRSLYESFGFEDTNEMRLAL